MAHELNAYHWIVLLADCGIIILPRVYFLVETLHLIPPPPLTPAHHLLSMPLSSNLISPATSLLLTD
jgi:hypothetical protein